MHGTRALLRLSVRAVRRAPLRSLLIVALIALMVGVGSMVATISRTDRVTAQDQIDGELGSADLSVSAALFPGGAPWGIFGSPEASYGSNGNCFTSRGPDGVTSTTCQTTPAGYGPVPVPLPSPPCPPGQECGAFATDEPTPEEQARIDEFEAWKSGFDPNAAAATLESLLDVDVTVIREAHSIGTIARSPFIANTAIEAIADLDLDSPINDRSARLVAGRAPQGPDEIATQVSRWGDQLTALGETVPVGDRALTVVGHIARAGFAGSPGYWGVVSPEAFDASTMEPGATRLRISGLRGADSPERLSAALTTISQVVGVPVTGATQTLLARPANNGNWSIVQRGQFDGFYRGAGNEIATAIGTTALTGLVGLQVVLVVATAFTVGRRRRAREFGQLITVGADARHLRRLALTEGAVLGLAGAITGIALGILFAWIGISQGWWGDNNPYEAGVRFSPVDWIGPAVAGLVAAVLSAWWPVRHIADAPLAAGALADVPPARPLPYIPKLGAVLAIGGVVGLAAVTLVSRSWLYAGGPLIALLAILATLLGLLVTIGTILSWVGRRADQLPLLARLVVRNSDRHRSRSWLVVGAFILTIGIPVAIGAAIEAYPNSFGGDPHLRADDSTFALATNTSPYGGFVLPAEIEQWTDDQVAAYERESGVDVAAITAIPEQVAEFAAEFTRRAPEVVGEVETATIQTLSGFELMRTDTRGNHFYNGDGRVAVATDEIVAFLGIDQGRIDAMSMTTALTFSEHNNPSSGFLMQQQPWSSFPPTSTPFPDGPGNETAVRLESIGDGITAPPGNLISTLVSPTLVESMGVEVVESGVMFRAAEPLTDAEDQALRVLADKIWWQTFDDAEAAAFASGVYLSTGTGWSLSGPTPTQYRLIVAAIATAIAALIALMTSALTAVESEDELESLIATGARPSIRRRFLGMQSLYHLALAAVLAVPTALILYWVVVQADEFAPRTPVVPWLSILLSAVVMPLVVAALIFALFRNGRPAVSRRLT